MGKTAAELPNEGVTIPLIVIDKVEEGVSRRTRGSLKHRSRSAEAIKLTTTSSDASKPPDLCPIRPNSASVVEGLSRLSTTERAIPKRSCSFSSFGDKLCSCSCQEKPTNQKTTDGVNGQSMASFYQLWKRKPVNDIASKSKLEPPSALKRSDKYRHCGCFTREHARKLSRHHCCC